MHFLEQTIPGKDRQRYALYLSALCALSDGLLVSAGVHFKKDRQKYRQPIQLTKLETAQRFTNYLYNSISYYIRRRD